MRPLLFGHLFRRNCSFEYGGGMSKTLLTDELWNTIEPLLPPEPPKPKGGRPRIGARAALRRLLCNCLDQEIGKMTEWPSELRVEQLPVSVGCHLGRQAG